MDPKKRLPKEDKSIRLMADIKIPVTQGKNHPEKPIHRKALPQTQLPSPK